MAFVVVYDACVLYPSPLRDFLIRVAKEGMVQAKWTDRILDECFDNIIADRPELSAQALARTAGHSGGTSRLSGRSPTH